ncbi:nitroreductase family protein [Candidatus Phycosocius spiralis]|uniref:Uncharacterized protein n=1 Tax=Candidatus Phycosocius spiralis TaxID=2815099 RepID=A0ABQ4PYL8_9PROT|nr:nitroreductase family protein [Candidatus Phycosocius spiralis]GIU68089.1 hypothetical protein PsB1_2243 [Candidatus Phycosocius spiralis]
MGMEGDDQAKRKDWVLRGFHQFDAPVFMLVTYDRVLDGSDDKPFDCGAVATALVNAAWPRRLGAVINSQGIMQSKYVREHAGIAVDQVNLKSIELGWPDDYFPANSGSPRKNEWKKPLSMLGLTAERLDLRAAEVADNGARYGAFFLVGRSIFSAWYVFNTLFESLCRQR